MSKHNFIDLFSGCGGLSLGLEMAGFQPVYVNELDENALETYLINREENYPYLRSQNYHSKDIKSCLNKNFFINLKTNLKNDFDISDVDLVCGGPPCQGYSGIGIRRSYKAEKNEIPSNHLYEDMTIFIKNIKPKIFLFENVQGLLTARWHKNGDKGEIFNDVLECFKSLRGYKVFWDLIYSKDFGIPQNRPRVFIVGIRKNFLDFSNIKHDRALVENILPSKKITAPSLENLLSDLIDINYLNGGETIKYPSAIQNKYQRYFRTMPDGGLMKKGSTLTEHKYSNHKENTIKRFKSIIRSKGHIPEKYKNKKFAQRLLPKKWNKNGPNITITSLPDDFIHFKQPRIPTIREWARLQTFPDWYKFCGKRTTGGLRRAGNPHKNEHLRELPKYTQIGNAVPVLLAKDIGLHFSKMIKEI